MFIAYVVLRNFESRSTRIDFGDFTVQRIGVRFKEFRELFSSVDINQDDWILQKPYAVRPPGPPGSPVGGIPIDVEDILLTMRLFKSGDIAFVKQAISSPGGRIVVQFPYRAMNDLNSYSTLRYGFSPEECASWKSFVTSLKESQSWNSGWFAVSRRYFLYGGAKEFNPKWDDVDRIVDYVTGLEAALVPETDFSRRRISQRAARLLSGKPDEQKTIASLIKMLYDIRSSVVHGSHLSDEKRNWLMENCVTVEQRVREVLVAAVRNVPPEQAQRLRMLGELFDLTDGERAEVAMQKIREIRSDTARKELLTRIQDLLIH